MSQDDANSEHENRIAASTSAVTLAYLLIGSFALAVVYFKLQDTNFENEMWQVKARSQAALQLQIAEQIGFRKTLSTSFAIPSRNPSVIYATKVKWRVSYTPGLQSQRAFISVARCRPDSANRGDRVQFDF